MPSFSLDLALETRAWNDQFDESSLRRARAYAVKIESVEVQDDGESVTLLAAVKGSARRPYVTRVTIRPHRRGGFDYDTECSCPVGLDCKHAAAVLMAAAMTGWSEDAVEAPVQTRAMRAPAPEWKQWLDALERQTRIRDEAATAVPQEPTRQIAVILDAIDSVVPARLVAKMVWVQPTRQGRLGKAEPVRVDGFGNDVDAGRLTPVWHDRLARLLIGPQAWHARQSGMRTLQGPNAEALLEDLLASDAPCFWQKTTSGAIRPGPGRALDWRWQMDARGAQRLQPGRGLLLEVDGLWLLDTDTHTLQRAIDADDARSIDALLRMPALAPEHSREFVASMHGHPVFRAVPLPEVIAVAAPRRIAPTAVLRLQQIPLGSAGWRHKSELLLPCARLAFDYAGAVLPGTPSRQDHQWVEDGTLHTMQRDRAAEAAAEAALAKVGLGRIRSHPWLYDRLMDVSAGDDYVFGRHDKQFRDPELLLQSAMALSPLGFRIETDAGFPLAIAITPDDWYAAIDASPSGEAWFDTELGIELDGERISLLPILQRALEDRRLDLTSAAPDETNDAVWRASLPDGRLVALPLTRLRALIAPLLQWMSGHGGGTLLRLPRAAAGVLDDLGALARLELRGKTAAALRGLAQTLREDGVRRAIAPPRALKASLRPYQQDGLTWLGVLGKAGLGGVLADDMGLGKTVQILAHLLKERESGRLQTPALVVCPTSVVGNWQEQAERFAPGLRLRILHGSDRHAAYESLGDCDLAITTYALLPRDRETLTRQRFALAVFDEAQALKNAASQAAQVARALRAGRKIAVTGTPLENHLGELWAQFDCVLPGLLGDARAFARHFRTPIEKHGDRQRQEQLNRRIAPFVLRRTKTQVAQDLPPKTEIVRSLELSGKQRALYETLRLSMHEKVQAAVEERGLAQSSIVILDALLKLRQACCDPRLVKLDAAKKATESAKLEVLLPMIEELLAEGRRILLFSQFTQMLDLIEIALRERDIIWLRLDGGSRDRAQLVKRFQSGEAPLFLISLKAGGVGLNLTAADTVIHYDPWWNPAVEAQATDRAHRIGQTQPVFVYKLICTGTVEEKIQALQRRKGDLARAVLEGGTSARLCFDEADIADLFAPM
jgi:superfamily II DNA or RNA helicase